jgi:branched-chain amino acid transport system substrate-binding protein
MPRTLVRVAASCALLAGLLPMSGVLAQTNEPIKVGVGLAETGPMGNLYSQQRQAVEFAVAEFNANGGMGGRKIDVKYVDTEGKPDVSRKQFEKLALEGYKLLFGTQTSAEGLAVVPNLQRWNAVLVSPISKSSKLIGEACQARHFRTDVSDPSELSMVSAWLRSRSETKWITIADDFAYGRDATDGFVKVAKDAGKQIVNSLFPQVGVADYAPYIQQIKDADPEGVFVVLSGRDAINFIVQAKQFGLLNKVVMAGMTYTQDAALSAVGLDAVGLWGTVDYSASIDTEQNKAFVSAWKQAYGVEPTDVNGQDYIGITILLQAIRRAGTDDPALVAKALSGGSFDTLLGKAIMRAADHQMLLPAYMAVVKAVDGKPHNEPMMTLSADKAAPTVDPACKMAPL